MDRKCKIHNEKVWIYKPLGKENAPDQWEYICDKCERLGVSDGVPNKCLDDVDTDPIGHPILTQFEQWENALWDEED